MGFMGFYRGEKIEVASKEDGFVGSYYEATVLAKLIKHEYLVQYKTLVKEDQSTPLKEVVTAAEVRPSPPSVKIPATGFEQYDRVFFFFWSKQYDRVDAFDNDGWWVGTITGKLGDKYYVFFEYYGEEIAYSIDRLRFHQDWVDDKWVLPRKISIYDDY